MEHRVTKTLGVALLLVVLTASSPLAQTAPYRIGPDDILAISVWDQKDLDQVVVVRPDGRISLALVGETEAGGLTVADLSAKLSKLYAQTVKGAQVIVTVREVRSRPVYFPGNVAKPGILQLTQELTVLQALGAVGGALPNADPEAAYVERGKDKIPVNLALGKSDPSGNLKLQPFDTVVLPNATFVSVTGEVKTPGQIKYSRDLTVVSAIASVGGLTQAASKRVTLLRNDGGKTESIRVNVGDIMDGDAPDVPLKPNDKIEVRQRLF
jgi:polysaccharide biosynthesis/export protein